MYHSSDIVYHSSDTVYHCCGTQYSHTVVHNILLIEVVLLYVPTEESAFSSVRLNVSDVAVELCIPVVSMKT